ncbi:hypothetical protein CEXT_499571 [Caerostris extrusa]|uniref:Uncharacterized protein n=1 Tax=Caerostris extrusa TaxID=172846 RepID=A0AAV4Y824_CAEEX|nr:hypothetical protein CEXT_499571 [Caerostris extrusa]
MLVSRAMQVSTSEVTLVAASFQMSQVTAIHPDIHSAGGVTQPRRNSKRRSSTGTKTRKEPVSQMWVPNKHAFSFISLNPS